MKNTYKNSIVILLSFLLISNISSAEITKEHKIDKYNQFEWYLLTDTETNKKGASDKNGGILVPIEFDNIYFSVSTIDKNMDLCGYFLAGTTTEGNYMAIYSQGGRCLIPTGKYCLAYDGDFDNSYHYLTVSNGDERGITDLNGKEIVPLKYKFIHDNKNYGDSQYKDIIFYFSAEDEDKLDIYNLQGELIMSFDKEDLEHDWIWMDNVFKHPDKPYFKVALKNNRTAFYDVAGKYLVTVDKKDATLYEKEDGTYWASSSKDSYRLNFSTTSLDPFIVGENFHALSFVSNERSNTYKQNSSSPLPNATGVYTISQQGQSITTGSYTGVAGPDITVTIEFYDDHIAVGGIYCEYAGESNGRKKYLYKFMGANDAYYVDGNYNVDKQSTFTSPYGTDWFNYTVQKGNVSIPKAKPYNASDSYHVDPIKSGRPSDAHSDKIYVSDCYLCHGSGKCPTCNGTHRVLNALTNKYMSCPNCKSDGACSVCGGTGKKH